jgi:hypothetical protein
MSLVRWVVTGQLDPADPGAAVSRWLRTARGAASPEMLTGGMLFDGERWVQVLEGPAPTIDALVVRLLEGVVGTASPRLQALGSGERTCVHWCCGYVEPAVIDTVQRALDVGPSSGALLAFVEALAAADAV